MMTNRLILRKLVVDDWPALYAIVSDPQVCHHVPFNPLSEEETRETVQVLVDGRQANPPRYDFALVLRSDETLIGQCFLVMRYDEKRQAEIGFVLNRHYWGCGYATEAARAVPRYGFHKLNLHRIYATYRPANVASARVLEKLAMRREGHLRRHRWMKGAWHDSYLYAILEDEWKLANPQPDPG